MTRPGDGVAQGIGWRDRSMEEQARRALAQAVGLDREAALRRLDEIRTAIGRREGASIVDDLRRDRRSDEA